MSIERIGGPGSIQPIEGKLPLEPKVPVAQGKDVKSFGDFLAERELGGAKGAQTPTSAALQFSNHAKARLSSRNIELTPDELLKMREAVDRARDKGSRESLILTDKAAFVVSVKNNTVITAMDRDSLKDNVFTNIDSTVMI